MLLEDFQTDRIENPIILWERGNLLTLAVSDNPRNYPPFDPQWIEHTIRFYCQLRSKLTIPELIIHSQAEAASTKYLQSVIDKFK
ncbi:hypothetical protein NIES4072_02540 [Nostoc commune NIES-4072]|uniref:Uncharacterized protein n=1 Tax=Nostoc commune NIES-4072 TaxID=2005467 RepID=A0A2R5FH15_NOSCO|nr:hypothetical protein [Nostoc commune]BBD66067.1 hypothetical protein NIES4070_24280 [Nostoc commune HK-02]GBG16608.1 hypothetical protein NIES4072_02540 [Nostoc commune NIES-4072]